MPHKNTHFYWCCKQKLTEKCGNQKSRDPDFKAASGVINK